MTTTELTQAIEVLTKIVQPSENNVSFKTQNKAQVLLADLVDELEKRK